MGGRAAPCSSFMRGLWVIAAAVCLCIAEVPPEEAALLRQAAAQPENFAANRRLAEYYLSHHQIQPALPWLEKAARIKPADYDNGYDLALARLETKDLEGAETLLREMLARQDRSELHNLLGDTEEAKGNVDEAAKQYETAARMDPSEKNLFDLGTDLLRHHAYPSALTLFRYAAGKFPLAARLQVGLGVALYSTGKYTEAVKTLCTAVDLDPADSKALDFLGKVYDVAPDLSEEVTRRLAHFAELYPNNPSANYYYALALRQRNLTSGLNGSEEKVEALLHKALALRPAFADAHFQLGLLYSDEKRTVRAVREFEETIRLRPDWKAAHYHLAKLYAEEGKMALSHREFRVFRSLKEDK
jgi:tetratricopeptide (TPR) repeat protein